MKASEKSLLTSLIAEWEWSQDVSGSSARARHDCAHELISTFGLTDDDLSVSRAMQLTKMAGYSLDTAGDDGTSDYDVVCDFFSDYIDDHGYKALCDRIEADGIAELAAAALNAKRTTLRP